MESVLNKIRDYKLELVKAAAYLLMLCLLIYIGCTGRIIPRYTPKDMCMIEYIGLDKLLFVCPNKIYLQDKGQNYYLLGSELKDIREIACTLSEPDQSITLTFGKTKTSFTYEEARKLCTNNGIDVFNMP
mgnify:CR=1 FL=1